MTIIEGVVQRFHCILMGIILCSTVEASLGYHRYYKLFISTSKSKTKHVLSAYKITEVNLEVRIGIFSYLSMQINPLATRKMTTTLICFEDEIHNEMKLKKWEDLLAITSLESTGKNYMLQSPITSPSFSPQIIEIPVTNR